MRVYLLRHAESVTNERGVWTGQSDVRLSKRGADALLSVRARFNYPKGDIYFSSPLRRCLDTLEIVYDRPADYKLSEFMECSLGSLEGKKYTSLDDDVNYTSWIEKPDSLIHGGESFSKFTSRVREGFLKMIKISAKEGVLSVVAVLHGNVMRAILCGFVDSYIPHQSWEIPNCGGYFFEYEECLSGCLKYEKIPSFLFGRG